ncbi:hypothetical protein ACFOUP_13970 [Belliella kenyensis]|uniref:DoxX-like family protein n=1 Tax=Belliella kenyensis TaxID=1472724 RepID=A0ABV8EMF0_9BACT|nr:hypothetical protein [Belliella kenyensis]MCH7401550.1 hypothetical protein [Belliella kenyensis]MDN3603170.1 hypothetical protein [Belliella kenyensis]
MEKNTITPSFPMPMRGLLLLTGMYTFAWSAFFRYFGDDLLKWLAMGSLSATDLSAQWLGSFGMLIGFFVFLSAFYPISWNYLIIAGIFGKLTLAIWFILMFVPDLGWNKRTIFHVSFTELLWLIPLITIYLRTIKVKDYLKTLPE